MDVGGPVRYRSWDGPEDTTFVLLHGLGGTHLNWVRVAPGLGWYIAWMHTVSLVPGTK